MGIIVYGYRTRQAQTGNNVQSLLKAIKESIEKKWNSLYTDLISDEVNNIADNYVLSKIQINPGNSILDVATERICDRISRSMQAQVCSRYNLCITLEIFPFKNKWYILVICNNPMLINGLLANIKCLETYNVLDDGSTAQAAKDWDQIRSIFTTDIYPLRQVYAPQLPISIGAGEILCQPVAERAAYRAISIERENILSALSANQPIPPAEIMQYIDEIDLEMESSEFHKEAVQERTARLLTILPELNSEMLTKKLGLDAQPQDQSPADDPPTNENDGG